MPDNNMLGMNRPLDELEEEYHMVLSGELQMEEEQFMWLEEVLIEHGRL